MMEKRGMALSGDADPEGTIFGRLFNDDIVAAMDSLPVKYRTAVTGRKPTESIVQ